MKDDLRSPDIPEKEGVSAVQPGPPSEASSAEGREAVEKLRNRILAAEDGDALDKQSSQTDGSGAEPADNGLGQEDDIEEGAGGGPETGTEAGPDEKPAMTPAEKAARSRHRRRAIKRSIPTVLVTLIYLVLMFAMFRTAANASLTSSELSLRYNMHITAQQVAAARHYWDNPDLSADFVASYWYESPKDTLTTERATADTPVLYVDGDMAAVLAVDFVQGGYPSAIESRGLAMSEGLAWKLFGGTRVVGAEITWKGATYTVRGIFAGEELQLLAQIDAADGVIEGFSAVELAGSPESEPRDAARAYVKSAGLPEPDVILSAQALPDLLWVIAWIPAVILIIWFVVRMLMLLHHVTFWKRQLTWLVVLFLLAFILPQMLSQLPGWIIPTSWSDFGHWSDFIKEINTRITDLLSVKPSLHDVQMRKLLILQVVLLTPALFAMVSAIRRWSVHMRRKELALRMGIAGKSGMDATQLLGEEAARELGLDVPQEESVEEEPPEQEEHDDILMLKTEKDVKKNPTS